MQEVAGLWARMATLKKRYIGINRRERVYKKKMPSGYAIRIVEMRSEKEER